MEDEVVSVHRKVRVGVPPGPSFAVADSQLLDAHIRTPVSASAAGQAHLTSDVCGVLVRLQQAQYTLVVLLAPDVSAHCYGLFVTR
jgi:hypothetical protein